MANSTQTQKQKAVSKIELARRIAALAQVEQKTIDWLAKQLNVTGEKKELLAKFLNPNGDRVSNILDGFSTVTTQALKSGEIIYVEGIGTLKTKHVGAKKGRNVRTKTAIDIPPTTRPKFTPSAALRRAVSGT